MIRYTCAYGVIQLNLGTSHKEVWSDILLPYDWFPD